MLPAGGTRTLVVWIQRHWTGSSFFAPPRVIMKGRPRMLPFSTPSSKTISSYPTYTPEVYGAFLRLRARYQQGADLWDERELAHLRFVRWLVQTGRLVEDGGPKAAAGGTRAVDR